MCVMYNDGFIGNRGILEVLGVLTAGQFNKALPQGKPDYKLQDIIPRSYDYLYPPLSDAKKKELVNKNLLSYVVNGPGVPQDLFKGQ